MKLKLLPFVFLFVLTSFKTENTSNNDSSIWQYSTINALLAGVFDGNISVGEIKKHGNFGIGTFNRLDGEMLLLNGQCFQIKADGKVYLASDTTKIPFCSVTNFVSDTSFQITDSISLDSLKNKIDKSLRSLNLFYAISISGEFYDVKTRSVPAQTKPYQTLASVTAKQPTFDLKNTNGTIIGFRLPEFAENINVAGYHLHYINNLKSAGGHLLQLKTKNVTVSIQVIKHLELELPTNSEFYKVNQQKHKADVNKVEKL